MILYVLGEDIKDDNKKMMNNVHVFEPNIKVQEDRQWLVPGIDQSASRNSATIYTVHLTLEVDINSKLEIFR